MCMRDDTDEESLFVMCIVMKMPSKNKVGKCSLHGHKYIRLMHIHTVDGHIHIGSMLTC